MHTASMTPLLTHSCVSSSLYITSPKNSLSMAWTESSFNEPPTRITLSTISRSASSGLSSFTMRTRPIFFPAYFFTTCFPKSTRQRSIRFMIGEIHLLNWAEVIVNSSIVKWLHLHRTCVIISVFYLQ